MALRSLKIAENSTDYSVNNTAKQMIWLPTSREEKYKAKQAIDTFFVRSGDMLAAGVVFLGTHGLALGVRRLRPGQHRGGPGRDLRRRATVAGVSAPDRAAERERGVLKE